MTDRTAIIGRGLFEVFPDNPDDLATQGERTVRASFERVIRNRVADTMPVLKYDIQRPESEGGGFEERFWSTVIYPRLGPIGELRYLILRVQEVTELIRQEQEQELTSDGEDDIKRMRADVVLRAREVVETNRQLKEANAALTAAQSTIRELSIPILSLKPGVLLLPLIGELDAGRAAQLNRRLLTSIPTSRARAVVMDVTGLAVLDVETVERVMHTVGACRLMGAGVVVTGLSVENASALAEVGGIDRRGWETAGDVQSGIERAERLLRRPARGVAI
jgi:anti-anti-sigma regulatory factor